MKELSFFKKAAVLVIFAAVGFAPKAWAGEHTWNGDGSLLKSIAKSDVITLAQGASGTLTVPENVTITIEGEVAEGTAITLYIPATSSVEWDANYSSKSENVKVVTIIGNGRFEVIGGAITAAGKGSTAVSATGNNLVVVSGGKLSANGKNGYVINSQNGNVTIEGGVVNAAGYPSTAIYAGGDIVIEGGVVMAQNTAFIGNAGVINKTPVGEVDGVVIRQDPHTGTTAVAGNTEGVKVQSDKPESSIKIESLQ